MVMIAKATKEQITQALAETNKKFDGNIEFNRFDPVGRRFAATLKVKDSHGRGARLGFPEYNWNTRKMIKRGKHMVYACWHAHGEFFDELLKICPEAVIVSKFGQGNVKITKDGGNWQDIDVGSKMFPALLSDLCECNDEGGQTDLTGGV